MKPIDREKLLFVLENHKGSDEWERAYLSIADEIRAGEFDIDPPVPDIHVEEECDLCGMPWKLGDPTDEVEVRKVRKLCDCCWEAAHD